MLTFHAPVFFSSINQCVVQKPAVTFDTQLLLHFNCWCVRPLWRCFHELSLLFELNGLADSLQYWEESAGKEASLATMFYIKYVTSQEQRVKPTGGSSRQNYLTISSPTFHPLVLRRLSSYFRTSQMTITAVSFIIWCLLFSSITWNHAPKLHQEVMIQWERDTFILRVSERCGFIIPPIISLSSGVWSPWQLAKQHASTPDGIIPPSIFWIYPSSLRSAKPPFRHHRVRFPEEADHWGTRMIAEHPPLLAWLNRLYSCPLCPALLQHLHWLRFSFSIKTLPQSPLSCVHQHCLFNVWFIMLDDSWLQLSSESHLQKCKCCQAVTQYSRKASCMEHWRNCLTLSLSIFQRAGNLHSAWFGKSLASPKNPLTGFAILFSFCQFQMQQHFDGLQCCAAMHSWNIIAKQAAL